MTTREQAIMILSVCASGIDLTDSAARALGFSEAAESLASCAWNYVANRNDLYSSEWWERYAEAECLLREGWTP